ncbi:MAG: tetratricopeptide repeat protein [Vicinamibacterales bacterium]
MAHSRIDDLRRRVEADPASIAFAQLAEEYRRAGQTEEAVRICRDGLTRHPGYLSARVTLGRALLDLGQLDEARHELQFVATEAPENLAAVRGLAEIFHREGDLPAALEHFQRALSLARHDPELEEIVQQLSRQVGAEAGSSNGLTFEEAHQELLSAAERVPFVSAAAPPAAEAEPASVPEAAPSAAPAAAPSGAFDFDTLVATLGTPAAPPLVEAVVSGETPEVFALPDIPAEGGDPFAALEAELRAQGDLEPLAIDDQVAALVDADAADDVTATEVSAGDWPEPPAAEAPADVESAPAVTVPEGEPPADAPWLTTRLGDEGSPEPQPVVEWGDAEVTVAEVAPPATLPDEPVAAPAPVLVVEGAFHLEVPMPSDEPVVTAPASGDALLAGVEEAMHAELDAAAVGPDAVERLMSGLTEAVEPPAAVAEPSAAASEAPQPSGVAAAVERDDVLGDLEDWLSTLQDRSSGQ